MSATSGCRAALTATWVTVDEQQVRCWAGFPSRLGGGGVTGHSGLTQQMSPSFTPQEPLCQTLAWAWSVEPGRRAPACDYVLRAPAWAAGLLLPADWVSLSLPLPCSQCTWWNRKGRRTTLGVRRPWLRAGLLSAAAASWRTWNEQPRPRCSLQARCLL